MNKRFFLLSAVSTIVFSAFACTNFIVGKKASTDGSVICSYNADSYGAYMPLYHYAAAKHQKGDKRQIYEWDTNKYLGEIDEALETYNVVGNINEWQVTIGETTYGGREEMVDSTGIIDYGSLIYIALQRSKSAREAIQVMTSLVEKYGYCSEGETFTRLGLWRCRAVVLIAASARSEWSGWLSAFPTMPSVLMPIRVVSASSI